jgi:replicative DNA helicase
MGGEEDGRHVPYEIEIEQAVLGSCLVDNEAIGKFGQLRSQDFYDPLHQRLLDEINREYAIGVAVSPLTLHAEMKSDPGLMELGGLDYLVNLARAAPAIPDIRGYIRILKNCSTRRGLIRLGEEIVTRAYEPPKDMTAQDQIEEAEKTLFGLAERTKFGARNMAFSEAVRLATQQAEKAQAAGGKISGIPTGLTEIDELLGGLQKTDLLIVAGRPGMGKTSLATNIAFHAAKVHGACQFFSLEMSAPQLSARILSEQSGIEMWRIRNGQMRPNEWNDFVQIGQTLSSLPLFIDDTGGLTIAQLTARARKAKRDNKISLVVVDYIQLLAGTKRSENRVQELTEITKGLKVMAKELDVPVIALSQLSRGVDSREDKRPVLSDLRESGSIEQDADVVMFVYREEYYVKSREPDIVSPEYPKWQERMEKVHGKAEVLVEKHRHGATKRIMLNFDDRFTRFRD